MTRPSHDSTMSFTFPVEIAEVLVKGGQSVKKGDVLIRGRDEEYRYQRDLQKLLAESDLDIQRAQAAMEQAQVEYDGQVEAKRKGAMNNLEMGRTETQLKLRKAELEIAKLQAEQNVLQLSLRQAQLDRLTMRAPFDGHVDKVSADVGEVKRETEAVVRVVSTEPLWIDSNPTTHESMTLGLKPGGKAWVLLDLPTDQPSVYVGDIIEVAAVADFGADTRRVRIELKNPHQWPAGVKAWVRFTPPSGDWAARVVDPQAQQRAVAGSEQAQGGAAQ